MQIPILNGIYADGAADLRTAYPVNLVPVPKEQGISQGYLRPHEGVASIGTGPGADRGGIQWGGMCYRAMGGYLTTVSAGGVVTNLGTIADDGLPVRFDYGFDRLAIASGKNLYYWDGITLTQVTDPDLGPVVDMLWVDSYYMTTDGANLVVTELNNPTQVNPLKYGSSEVDPDAIKAILKISGEVYAVNRHTIEVFSNVGGEFFPFQRNDGAMVDKGAVGTRACCVFMGAIAMIGSGRNEPPAIYLALNGGTSKVSTREIDTILQSYSEAELAAALVESRMDRAHQFLYVHLHDRTMVYDAAASTELSAPVWFHLTSDVDGFAQYRAKHFVWAYNRWIVGDPQSSNVGVLSDTIGSHWGNHVRWEFSTTMLWNESKGALLDELELVALPGRVALSDNPQISTAYTLDGETWSQPRTISAGQQGDRLKRLCWFGQGAWRNYRMQRFTGDTRAHLSVLRLEATASPLAY